MENHIFNQSARPDGMIDLRLLFFAQVDGLCITSTLKVENVIVSPAVFIITNQFTSGVGTQGSLTRTTETKENGRITGITHIGAAVHTQHIFFQGQDIIQYAEYALLYFTGVSGTGNQDHSVFERNHGRVVLAYTTFLGI